MCRLVTVLKDKTTWTRKTLWCGVKGGKKRRSIYQTLPFCKYYLNSFVTHTKDATIKAPTPHHLSFKAHKGPIDSLGHSNKNSVAQQVYQIPTILKWNGKAVAPAPTCGHSSGNSRTYRGDATKQDPPPNKKFHGHYFETRAHLNRERHLCACTSFVEPLVATHGVRGECP